ncbi:MAG: hypothetical protein ACP5UZ_04320, partial [Thermoplasmata archaeon]
WQSIPYTTIEYQVQPSKGERSDGRKQTAPRYSYFIKLLPMAINSNSKIILVAREHAIQSQ